MAGTGASGSGCRNVDRSDHLFVRPKIFAARFARCRREGSKPGPHCKTKLTRRDITAIVVLIGLLPFLTIAIIPNQQIFNAYLLWAEAHAKLPVLPFYGKQMPTTWLITLDSIVSVSFLFIAVIFWRLWSNKFREPAEITKIAIGSVIAVTGMLSLAIGAAIAAKSGEKVSFGWLVGFHILNSAASPTSFPFRSRFTHAWPRLPYLPRSSASIISPFSPPTIWSAGSAVCSKKWRPRNSGSYTPALPGSQVLFFSSPAEFSAIYSLPMMTPGRLTGRSKP